MITIGRKGADRTIVAAGGVGNLTADVLLRKAGFISSRWSNDHFLPKNVRADRAVERAVRDLLAAGFRVETDYGLTGDFMPTARRADEAVAALTDELGHLHDAQQLGDLVHHIGADDGALARLAGLVEQAAAHGAALPGLGPDSAAIAELRQVGALLREAAHSVSDIGRAIQNPTAAVAHRPPAPRIPPRPPHPPPVPPAAQTTIRRR